MTIKLLSQSTRGVVLEIGAPVTPQHLTSPGYVSFEQSAYWGFQLLREAIVFVC